LYYRSTYHRLIINESYAQLKLDSALSQGI
jgi:hypothetical protein